MGFAEQKIGKASKIETELVLLWSSRGENVVLQIL